MIHLQHYQLLGNLVSSEHSQSPTQLDHCEEGPDIVSFYLSIFPFLSLKGKDYFICYHSNISTTKEKE